MTLLALDSVTKRYGAVTAVDRVSFAIDRGQVVGFLGPNGAGKSTTMRMITQYHDPDGGSILFDGVPLADAGREAKRRVGYLPENNPLYTDMLVSEYLQFVGRLRELGGAELARGTDESVVATGNDRAFVIKRTPCQCETVPRLQPPLVGQGVALPVELLAYQMLATAASHLTM